MHRVDTTFKYLDYIGDFSEYYEKQAHKESQNFDIQPIDDEWYVDKEDPIWTSYMPKNKKIERQGWKIHVSTRFSSAEGTLKAVSELLLKLNIPFKHIRNKDILYKTLSKNGDRITSGKFITIYPEQAEFIPLLHSIYENTKHLPLGPYILTDKRWKNSNIYYRYGAFIKILNEQGVLCIYDNEGRLVPDQRKPIYHLPDFVQEPEELKNMDEYTDYNDDENKLGLYNIERALRFSNSGGIYVATRVSDKKKCVIKEARSEVGLDNFKRTAEQRLQVEEKTISKLHDVDGIVKKVDYFKVWENTFLVEEFVEGVPLWTWFATNYPFSKDCDINEYFSKVKTIMDSLVKTVTDMHAQGIAMCDLHPYNIIIGENLNITLIDFEVASDANSKPDVGMHTKGFSNNHNIIAKDMDWYAVNRILQFCFLPIGPVYDLDMKINTQHCVWIYKNFGREIYDYFHKFQLMCCENITESKLIFQNTYNDAKRLVEKGLARQAIDIQESINKLHLGLINNCDPKRGSLINGDIRQFEEDCGLFNLQNGGFGAAFALFRTLSLTEDAKKWIEENIKQICNGNYNNGLLTGRSGIACALYEFGYTDVAYHIMDSIDIEHSSNTNDLSLRSGLVGVGLAFLAFYNIEKSEKYLDKACAIAITITKIMGDSSSSSVWDKLAFGLLDGYSGISVFFSLLYSITQDKTHLDASVKTLQHDIGNLVFSENDGSMNMHDAENNRVLPYLSNGSLGVGIAISLLGKVSKKDFYTNELEAICKVINSKICIDANFFDGLGSFFIAGAICNKQEHLQETIEKIQPFLIHKKDFYVLPGYWSYKLSSDVQSGTAGILLAIETAKSKNPLYWLPLISNLAA